MMGKLKSSKAVMLVLLSVTGVAIAGGAAKPASAQQLTLLRAAMQESLKDADSAKVRNVKVAAGTEMRAICGQINAKNSYGAFVGYKTFFGQYLPAGPGRKAIVIIMGIQEGDNPAVSIMCEKEGVPQSA